MYPENYRYTKEHEWVHVEGGIGTVGITDHAQKELGDIVYVDLPKVGTRVEQGKSLGSVESVKAVSDVYSPVSGEVTEANQTLADAPEKLNQDPHGAAWLVKIRLSAPAEIENEMTGVVLHRLAAKAVPIRQTQHAVVVPLDLRREAADSLPVPDTFLMGTAHQLLLPCCG